MKRFIVTVHLKDIILTLVLITAFIVLLPLILLGGSNKDINKNNITKYDKNNNVGYEQNYIIQDFSKIHNINSNVKVFLTKENRIKEMSLEEYIVGVVAKEMPASFEEDALKAQAVAARTYALSHMESAGGYRCPNSKGADLCDSVHCQAYISREGRIKLWLDSLSQNKAEEYWGKISKVVNDTYGQILTYNGEIVMSPYYFSTSSGKTESASDVFAKAEPYLKSVSSPGEERSPKFESTFKYKINEFIDIMNKKYPVAKIESKSLSEQITILKRSEGGAVKEIRVGNSIISGLKFRTILGLTSANFQLNFTNDDIEINCNGYGHGVGMSQWGADAMAKAGRNYINILKHYYQGVEIERIKYNK